MTHAADLVDLPRVGARRLSEQVYETLRQAIVSSRIAPGERLNEVALAGRLGVSRGPVREATMRLVEEGLVTSVANRGSFVTRLSADDLREVYLLRAALEGLAAQLSAGGDHAAEFEEMERTARDMIAAARRGDLDQVAAHDRRFHLRLVRLPGRGRLAKMWATLRDQIAVVARHALEHEHADPVAIAQHHLHVLQAVRSGQGTKARRLVEKHIAEASQRAVEVMLAERATIARHPRRHRKIRR